MTFTTRTTCRLCSGPLRTILELEPTPPANALLTGGTCIDQVNRYEADGKTERRVPSPPQDGYNDDDEPEALYPLTLAQCSTCSHVQIREIVAPSVLFTADYSYASGTSPVFRAHLQRLARSISTRLYPGDLVVEIGSNDGTLLRALDPGLHVLGVDPAAQLADEVTADGLLTYPGFFTKGLALAIRAATGPARRVVALNVLAHIADLAAMAEAIRCVLADDGELILEVAYLPDQIATNNYPGIYHEHADYFALRPLLKFYARHGLYLYDAERVPTQGGSIRCHLATRKKAVTEQLANLLLDEDEHLPAALEKWPDRVEESRAAICNAVKALKEAGHTIAGYGASAKGTTLLHACGLGREEISYILEDNPRKVGKFTPGKHIPIVHASELVKRHPDYAVILSGNFSESIRARNPEYRGKWVDLLPVVKVHT